MPPHKRTFAPEAACPLDDIRVLDLSRLVAGNMASLQLADFGAEVIKIEDPNGGDPLRQWRVGGVSAYWKVYARNKKSVALNLHEDRARTLLLALAETAHVLIESFVPGTLESMGLGEIELHKRNPGLVILRISGFGQNGPYRDRPGFGTLVEAMSGFAAKNGYADRPPLLPTIPLADMVAGLYGAFAVLVALREREVRGGAGQVIDLPLLDPLNSILGPDAAIYRLTRTLPARTGSRTETVAPRNVFRTSDKRWIAVSASTQAMAERLFRAIGRADLLDDPRCRTNADRVKDPEACEWPISEFVANRTLAQAMDIFEKSDVAAAPVYDIDQFINDPHVVAREVIVELPDKEMGTIPMHNIVPRLSVTPGRLRRAAPALGEHTAEILAEIGCSPADLDELYAAGIICARLRKR